MKKIVLIYYDYDILSLYISDCLRLSLVISDDNNLLEYLECDPPLNILILFINQKIDFLDLLKSSNNLRKRLRRYDGSFLSETNTTFDELLDDEKPEKGFYCPEFVLEDCIEYIRKFRINDLLN